MFELFLLFKFEQLILFLFNFSSMHKVIEDIQWIRLNTFMGARKHRSVLSAMRIEKIKQRHFH